MMLHSVDLLQASEGEHLSRALGPPEGAADPFLKPPCSYLGLSRAISCNCHCPLPARVSHVSLCLHHLFSTQGPLETGRRAWCSSCTLHSPRFPREEGHVAPRPWPFLTYPPTSAPPLAPGFSQMLQTQTQAPIPAPPCVRKVVPSTSPDRF